MSAITYWKKQLTWLRLREIQIYGYKYIWKIVWQHNHLTNNKVYVYPNHGILTGCIDPGKNLLQCKCQKSIFNYLIVKMPLFFPLQSASLLNWIQTICIFLLHKSNQSWECLQEIFMIKQKKSQIFSGRYNNFTCYQHFLFTLEYMYLWA